MHSVNCRDNGRGVGGGGSGGGEEEDYFEGGCACVLCMVVRTKSSRIRTKSPENSCSWKD